MKRLTALALAGVLLFGTACGGTNQTNSEAAKSDAGATTVQEQAADGAEEAEDSGVEEAADSSAGAADSSADAAKENASTSGNQNKGIAKGGKGDAIITEDENVFTGDGTDTAFIGDPF